MWISIELDDESKDAGCWVKSELRLSCKYAKKSLPSLLPDYAPRWMRAWWCSSRPAPPLNIMMMWQIFEIAFLASRKVLEI